MEREKRVLAYARQRGLTVHLTPKGRLAKPFLQGTLEKLSVRQRRRIRKKGGATNA